jgi:hypothetical protein
MCGASASMPEAMMVLAVQKLYYNINPTKAVGIFLILSTQMLGYGVAGLLRQTLVYPCKMIFPINLPIASIVETLHRDASTVVKNKMRIFNISFIILLLWQSFPQYISEFALCGIRMIDSDSASNGWCLHLLPDDAA